MTALVRNGVKVHVNFDPTPALFVAVTDNYCGCQDCAPKMPMGYGKTEETAVSDLFDAIEASA